MVPTRWIIQGSGTNTDSKFYSKNQASFEATGKALSFSNGDWDFTLDPSKQWPTLNVPTSLATGHTQNPTIPTLPTNFHEGPQPQIIQILANASSSTKVIIVFNQTIKNPDATKFMITTNGTIQKITNVEANTNQAIITLENNFSAGDTIKTTLLGGAIQNNGGYANIADTIGKTSTVEEKE